MKRTPVVDTALLAIAVVLMLGGAALMLAGVVGAGLAIPLIALGIALVAVVQTRRRGSHAAFR